MAGEEAPRGPVRAGVVGDGGRVTVRSLWAGPSWWGQDELFVGSRVTWEPEDGVSTSGSQGIGARRSGPLFLLGLGP